MCIKDVDYRVNVGEISINRKLTFLLSMNIRNWMKTGLESIQSDHVFQLGEGKIVTSIFIKRQRQRAFKVHFETDETDGVFDDFPEMRECVGKCQ